MDILYLALILAFFGLSIVLVYGCDKLRKGTPGAPRRPVCDWEGTPGAPRRPVCDWRPS